MPIDNRSFLTFVGTYTRRESFVDGKGEGIYVLRFDGSSGALQHISTQVDVVNPSFLALAPGGSHLYAVNEISRDAGPHGSVSAFVIDSHNGSLIPLNRESSQGSAPCHLSVDQDGAFVLVANYESGNLCVLPIRAGGYLDAASDVVQLHGTGPDRQRQDGPHAHMIVPGPKDGNFFAVDLGADMIYSYQLDRRQGRLVASDPAGLQLPPGTGPRHIVFHPNGRFAYIISELQSVIIGCQFEPRQMALHPGQILSTLPPDHNGPNLGAEIVVAPTGRFLYASNRGHDSIALYTVNPNSGALSLIGHQSCLGTSPRYITLDPTGSFLLVANQDTDTIISFHINQQDGSLTDAQVMHVPTPVCIRFLA